MRWRILVLLVFAFSAVETPNLQAAPSRDDLARQFMTSIAQGNNSDVISHFSADLKASLTQAQMTAAWSSITQRVGAFSKILTVATVSDQGQSATLVLSQFAKGNATLTVSFNGNDEVQGLWIAPNSSLTQQQMEAVARALVDQLSKRDYSDVELKFNDTMKSVLPPDKLSQMWNQALTQLGAFSQILVAQKNGIMDSVDVKCSFASHNAVVRVAFDADNKVGGLWILPTQ